MYVVVSLENLEKFILPIDEKSGRYSLVSEQLALRTVGKWILLEIKFLGSICESMPEHRL
jgi:hypothetical protein